MHPDDVKGWYLDLGSHVEPLGRDLHQNSLAEDKLAIKGKELPIQGGDGGCTNSLVVPEGKEVDTIQYIDEQDNGEGQALIAHGSNLLTNIVGCGVCIRQANAKWSKQGAVGAIKGSLETLSKRAVKAGCGGAGTAMIGCSATQEGPN